MANNPQENSSTKDSSTKDKIIETTCKLMSIKGVKETSLADIAKEVGISKGTLYYHYSSKDDIIYDIADYHLKKITAELLELIESYKSHSTPDAMIVMVFKKILDAETRGKLHLYLLGDAVMGNASLKQRFNNKYKEWHHTLEEGLRMIFGNRDVNYIVLSQVLLAMLDGFLIQRMIGVEPVSLEDVANVVTQSVAL